MCKRRQLLDGADFGGHGDAWIGLLLLSSLLISVRQCQGDLPIELCPMLINGRECALDFVPEAL